jgi:F-type H+-transporting ATPase subunit epsilon
VIALLRGGTIRLYDGDAVTETLFVTGGFVEVTPQRVTVLADETFSPANVSRAEGERRLVAAQAEYDACDKMDIVAIDLAMDRMQSARAMIEVAQAA